MVSRWCALVLLRFFQFYIELPNSAAATFTALLNTHSYTLFSYTATAMLCLLTKMQLIIDHVRSA